MTPAPMPLVIHPLMWVIAVLFLVYFFLEPLQQLL